MTVQVQGAGQRESAACQYMYTVVEKEKDAGTDAGAVPLYTDYVVYLALISVKVRGCV